MAFGFDHSIILGATRTDPTAGIRTLADLAGQRLQHQQAQATLADLLRRQEQETKLSDILSQNADTPDAIGPALMRGGLGGEAMKWMDRQGEMEARRAAAQKSYQDSFRQRAELLGRPFRGVKDQAGLDAAFNALRQAGFADEQLSSLPRQYDAQSAPFFERLASLGLSTENAERLEQRDEELDQRRRDKEAWRQTVAEQRKTTAEAKKAVALGDDTKDLRKEISGRPEISKYRKASAELESLRALAKESSGANDMAIVFAFMKAMDPESVVRESEYAAAAKTGTPDQRMMGLVSKYWTGGPLSPGQRAAFIKAAEAAQSGHKAAHDKAIRTYDYTARKRGIDRAEIGIAEPPQPGTPGGLSAEEAAELEALEREFGGRP